MHEIYKRYRPTTPAGLVGQEETVRVLNGWFKKKEVPHAILLSGPSGCGKTTIARIICNQLNCARLDFKELNAADFKGIDTIRSIRAQVGMKGLRGGARVWLLDEAHKLTKDAQDAALKLLEDTKPHAYFVLATTDPDKISATIRNRCTCLHLRAVPRKPMLTLLTRVAEKEMIQLTKEVQERLIEVADGSPRKALVLLEQIALIEDEEQQLESLLSTELRSKAMQLVQALMPFKKRPSWKDVVAVLKTMDDEPETVRHIVLKCASNELLKGDGSGPRAMRANLIIEAFGDNFYDSKQAGLINACWNVFHAE